MAFFSPDFLSCWGGGYAGLGERGTADFGFRLFSRAIAASLISNKYRWRFSRRLGYIRLHNKLFVVFAYTYPALILMYLPFVIFSYLEL